VTLLVDSDILIEVSRGKDDGILRRWRDLAGSVDAILCSPVSVVELWHGARRNEHEALERLFGELLCVPIDQETGRLAGEYMRLYCKSHGLELGDALIAAGAAQHGAALWTRNRKHYPMKDLAIL
jgi:predicted nucleic acid-binding protein